MAEQTPSTPPADAPNGQTARQSESALRLLFRAAGGPGAWAGKSRRAMRTAGLWVDRRELRRRLEQLQARGYIEQIPSAAQLGVGGLDMLRYFISPGARSYYETRGINFTFHQVLRFLDDPVSVIDPVGLLSERDTIVGHLLQVVHANPLYDVQLLEMFPDGVDELERQIEAMLAGTHPRQQTIGAIVEDPDYHRQLLDWLRAWRRDPDVPEMRRDSGEIQQDPDFILAEETFGTLPGFFWYANRLPADRRGLWRHWRNDTAIPADWCPPEARARARQRIEALAATAG